MGAPRHQLHLGAHVLASSTLASTWLVRARTPTRTLSTSPQDLLLRSCSNLRVLKLALKLLGLAHLANRFHEILLDNVVPLCPNRVHARLSAHVAQIGGVEAIGELDDTLVVNVTFLSDGRSMNLEDIDTASLVGQRDLDLAVETARAHQCRVEHVWSVGRTYHLDLAQGIEAIKLIEKLHQRALDLAISGCPLREAAPTNRIDLVHEDDAWLVIPRVAKHLANEARRLADVLVDDGGGDHLEELGVDVVGDSAC
mmetsp:Transcript_79136/g.157319  ORF Transcript_79136/g.157319 Transcript_79136/m.157319 type:complete len:255 (-) Transcript_79136:649-1413(-)